MGSQRVGRNLATEQHRLQTSNTHFCTSKLQALSRLSILYLTVVVYFFAFLKKDTLIYFWLCWVFSAE